MTNEELVTRIQAGERERMGELWEQVERFVAMQAARRMVLTGGMGGVTAEDLYQSGYLGLVAAVDSFDPAAGRSFIGWLSLALKTAFAEAGGGRTRKRDPIQGAASLDTPFEDSGDTWADLQEDPSAAQAMEAVEDGIWLEQLHAALERAMMRLPECQCATLRRRFWDGQSLEQVAAGAGVCRETARQWQEKALWALRQRRELRQFVEERTPYYMNLSARSGERTTEIIALRREELWGRH